MMDKTVTFTDDELRVVESYVSAAIEDEGDDETLAIALSALEELRRAIRV